MSSEDTDSYERLLTIIQHHFPSKERLTRDTVLQSLHFDGIDAMDLMDAVLKAFPIDWSEFRYHDYFYDEPPSGLGDKIELKVGELYDAIVAGEWKNPVPDTRRRIKGASSRSILIFLAAAIALLSCLLFSGIYSAVCIALLACIFSACFVYFIHWSQRAFFSNKRHQLMPEDVDKTIRGYLKLGAIGLVLIFAGYVGFRWVMHVSSGNLIVGLFSGKLHLILGLFGGILTLAGIFLVFAALVLAVRTAARLSERGEGGDREK